ncbi:hypothetical protein [Nonomuraea sp. NPDC002799]
MSALHISALCVILAVLTLTGYIVRRLSDVAPKTIAAILLALATLLGSIPLLLGFFSV